MLLVGKNISLPLPDKMMVLARYSSLQ